MNSIVDIKRAIERIKQTYKIRLASEIEKIEAIPTGLNALDNHVLGIGGFPKGRVVELFGSESGGKSTLAQKLIAQAQKLGILSVWLDAEGVYDPDWGEKTGINNDLMLLPDFSYAEEALGIIKKFLKSGEVGLIVLDSVAALQPRVVYRRADEADPKIAATAQILTLFFQDILGGTKDNPKLSDSKVSIVFINQIRERIGVIYGSSETTPGGRFLKHAASIRLELRKAGYSEEKDADGKPVKQKIRIKAIKNKCAPPLRSCEIWLSWDGKFDQDYNFILSLAVQKGLASLSGGWITIGAIKLHGIEEFKKYCDENKEYLSGIIK